MDKLKRYLPVAVGLLLGVFMILLEGRDLHVVIIVSVIAVVVLAVIIAMEKLDDSRREKLDNSIFSGERYASQKWRSQQESFCRKHGFRQPRGSMRQDLLRHSQDMSGLCFILIGVIVAAVFGLITFLENDVTALIFGVVVGVLIICYGYYKLRSPKLRRLIAELEQHPKFDILNEAYMRGKTISRRRSGLNLGAGIVTLFSPKALVPVTFNEVREIHYYIEHRINYTNGLYSSSENHFYVKLLAGDDNSVKEFPVELGERATVEAIEQLAQAGLPVYAEMLGIDSRRKEQ